MTLSRLAKVALAMAAVVVSETNTVRSPEDADRHDLKRSARDLARIKAEKAAARKAWNDQQAAPFREQRRARKALNRLKGNP